MIREKKREETNVKAVKVRNLTIGEGMPKICVPIVGETVEEILRAAKEIPEVPADLVEWRADWFEKVFEIEEVIDLLGKLRQVLGEMPLLFTFRTKAEDGEKEIGTQQYMALNKAVIETGKIDLVDVEVFAQAEAMGEIIDMARQYGVKVVGSNHDFAKTPDKEEIIRRLCHMQTVGADLLKIAVMPQSEKDVITLLSATQEMASEYAERPIITMSMAGAGTVSRISGEIFGSSVTFGAVKKASAPGQIGVKQLKSILEILHQAR